MWPTIVDASAIGAPSKSAVSPAFDGDTFSFDQCKFPNHTTPDLRLIHPVSNSLYDYLPKEYMLLGGRLDQYRRLYTDALKTAINHIVYRPRTEFMPDIRITGRAHIHAGALFKETTAQHTQCFAGGMIAIGSRIFNQPTDMDLARKLTEGCVWLYSQAAAKVMPETSYLMGCVDPWECSWEREAWCAALNTRGDAECAEKISHERLFPGAVMIPDRSYNLRAEAVESIFVMSRATGDRAWQEAGWRIFGPIHAQTKTDHGNAALADVTLMFPPKTEHMESYWMSRTLKYFYLLYSDSEVLSLDEYVFNAQGHPFKRPMA
jgi:mannosyl-oligosaccharide alpha-1,2-mannosidase